MLTLLWTLKWHSQRGNFNNNQKIILGQVKNRRKSQICRNMNPTRLPLEHAASMSSYLSLGFFIYKTEINEINQELANTFYKESDNKYFRLRWGYRWPLSLFLLTQSLFSYKTQGPGCSVEEHQLCRHEAKSWSWYKHHRRGSVLPQEHCLRDPWCHNTNASFPTHHNQECASMHKHTSNSQQALPLHKNF